MTFFFPDLWLKKGFEVFALSSHNHQQIVQLCVQHHPSQLPNHINADTDFSIHAYICNWALIKAPALLELENSLYINIFFTCFLTGCTNQLLTEIKLEGTGFL